MVFVEVDGKPVPLDPRAPVYRVFPPGTAGPHSLAERAFQKTSDTYVGPLYMVSHFATCPKASEMSNRGRT